MKNIHTIFWMGIMLAAMPVVASETEDASADQGALADAHDAPKRSKTNDGASAIGGGVTKENVQGNGASSADDTTGSAYSTKIPDAVRALDDEMNDIQSKKVLVNPEPEVAGSAAGGGVRKPRKSVNPMRAARPATPDSAQTYQTLKKELRKIKSKIRLPNATNRIQMVQQQIYSQSLTSEQQDELNDIIDGLLERIAENKAAIRKKYPGIQKIPGELLAPRSRYQDFPGQSWEQKMRMLEQPPVPMDSAPVSPEINAPDEDGTTPLMRLIQEDDVTPDQVYAMLDAGAWVDIVDQTGMTPLMIALNNERDIATENNQEIIKELIRRDPRTVNMRDNAGATALMFAAGNRYVPLPIIRMLVDAGADIDAVNDYGHNVMWHAGDSGRPDIIKYLRSINQ